MGVQWYREMVKSQAIPSFPQAKSKEQERKAEEQKNE